MYEQLYNYVIPSFEKYISMWYFFRKKKKIYSNSKIQYIFLVDSTCVDFFSFFENELRRVFIRDDICIRSKYTANFASIQKIESYLHTFVCKQIGSFVKNFYYRTGDREIENLNWPNWKIYDDKFIIYFFIVKRMHRACDGIKLVTIICINIRTIASFAWKRNFKKFYEHELYNILRKYVKNFAIKKF